MTEAIQTVEDTCCGQSYHVSWCSDMLCIASLCVGFKAAQINVKCSLIWELML